jgi:paraquat-inducible protein A
MTAADRGLLVCRTCGTLCRRVRSTLDARCPRCRGAVHFRRRDSIGRTWAFLIAALILYIPANLLPVTETRTLFGVQRDTIMSGIVLFWTTGSPFIAAVVFAASMVIPMLKFIALAILAITAQRRSRWRPQQRAKLYRLLGWIGRWSMLDVFVVTIVVALVHIQPLATINAGPGIAAFGAVVILTMLASNSFDPRLIWDPVESNHDNSRSSG